MQAEPNFPQLAACAGTGATMLVTNAAARNPNPAPISRRLLARSCPAERQWLLSAAALSPVDAAPATRRVRPRPARRRSRRPTSRRRTPARPSRRTRSGSSRQRGPDHRPAFRRRSRARSTARFSPSVSAGQSRRSRLTPRSGAARKAGTEKSDVLGSRPIPRQHAIMRECSSARKAGALMAAARLGVMAQTAKRASNLRISAEIK